MLSPWPNGPPPGFQTSEKVAPEPPPLVESCPSGLGGNRVYPTPAAFTEMAVMCPADCPVTLSCARVVITPSARSIVSLTA
jgi:hypothetical protein